MKKTLKVFALTALAFTMIFTSCKKDVKPNIDVVQVEASKITVEAYPCENRISWTPVSNADYALYRNGSKLNINANSFIYVDYNIVDGVEYEYKIITTPKADFKIKNEFGDQVTALGGSNKTAYYTKGNSASAKVTAIVPATTITDKDGVTTAITAVDLIDFDKKAKKTSKVTADNFVFGLKDNYFYYSFPAVDYLEYNVSCYRGNEKDYILFNDAVSNIEGPYNGKAKSKLITEPGDYTLVLKVTKAGYADTVIEAKTPITVKTLDVKDPTEKPKVKYIDGGKTARIWWTPATKADGSNWASANYNVYLVDRENNYTSIISETVKVDILDTIRDSNNVEDKDFYYVDYVLPEGESNLIKNFCVVLSSEDGIEKIEKDKRTCILESVDIEIAEGTGDPTAKYIDEDTACIYWTPAKTSDGKNWPTVNYTLYEVNETGFWEKKVLPEGTTITEAIIDRKEVYCVNVEISDTNRKYGFGVQLADGDKKEVAKYGYLDPRLLDILVDENGNKYFTGNPQVAYINENTARIWWTPAVKKDKKDWPAENYTVYTIDENGFWTKETVDIKSTINDGKDVYYVEFNIEDTTKEYKFGIELADGDKKESVGRLSCTLAAKTLDIADSTGNPSAKYISEDTVRIWWTPATKESDESEWAPANYTVYVKDENGFFDTITDIEVKEDSKVGDVVYYVEYTVEDNEEDYTFEVVLTIDGDYVDIKETEEVGAYKESPETTVFDASKAEVEFTSLDNTDLFNNDAVLSITLAEDQKVDFVKYKVLTKSDDFIFPAEALLDSAFVELTVAENYYDWMDKDNDDTTTESKFIVKNLKEGDRIVFLYSIVEEDKKPICKITSINVVDTSDVVDTFKDAIDDLDDLNDPISITPTYNRADDKSNWTVSFDLSTTSLEVKDNWTVQIFYAKLANDDNSVVWKEIEVPDFALNEAKDTYVAKTKEVVLEIDTEVGYDPFDGDFTGYEDTYAIKYVYTCEGISEPIEEIFTETRTKERQ